jgi:hypothetical protein
MADTEFTAKVTKVLASWLNDVNQACYRAIGKDGGVPVSPAEVRNNLGLTAQGGAALIGNTPTGTIASTTVQGAINEVVSDLAASSGASLIGLAQSGIGASTRTVQAKLREIISVKDFGATGDGSTDDSAAIAAAIAAVKTNLGGAIYVPAGRYRCASTITIDESPPLKFIGDGAKITTTDGTATELRGSVFINAAAGVLFDIVDNGTAGEYETRGIYFDGIGVQQNDDVNDIAFRISAAKDKFRFKNGAIRGGKYGVSFTGSGTPFNVKWEDFDFYSMQSGVYIPFWAGSDFLNMQWEDCTFRFCTRYAVEAQNGNSFYFKNNMVEACDLGGLYLAGVFNIGLDSNHFEQNGGDGTKYDVYVLSNSVHLGSATTKQLRSVGNTYTQDTSQAIQVNITGALSMVFENDQLLAGGGGSTTGLTINTPGGQSALIIGSGYDTGVSVTGAAVNYIKNTTGRLLAGTVTENTSGDKAGHIQLKEAANSGIYLGNTDNTGLKVLDWYEEGSWTPVLSFGGASVDITYSTQEGRFQRVGNWVHATCSIILTSKGSSTGVASIAGLPYATANLFSSRGGGGMAGYWANFAAALTTPILVRADNNASTVSVWTTGGAGVPTQLTDANFQGNSQLNFRVSYKVP